MKLLSCLSIFLLLIALSIKSYSLEVQVLNKQKVPIVGMAVYLTADSLKENTTIAQSTPFISQKNKKFQPYITVVQAHSLINFDNQDDITHHIYSAVGKNKFSFKIHKDEHSKQQVFNYTGIVPMGCNIHDWMSGHVLVVDTPLYGLTDGQGKVHFENVPEQTIVNIWHPQASVEDNKARFPVSATENTLLITLKEEMAPIPEQKSLDDFDFLDNY